MTENLRYILAWTPAGWEWIVILVVALLIFGRRLPEMLPKIARSIGKSLHEFKEGVKEVEETKDELEEDVKKIKDDVANETKKASGPDDSDLND
jgi:sec-independent protein translocase protein TatA